MSQVRRRHAQHYLNQVTQRNADWQWFDAEWLQIRHAWSWIEQYDDNGIALAYLKSFEPFLDKRGLWHEVISWSKFCLSNESSSSERGAILGNLGVAHYRLGQAEQAVNRFEQALSRNVSIVLRHQNR